MPPRMFVDFRLFWWFIIITHILNCIYCRYRGWQALFKKMNSGWWYLKDEGSSWSGKSCKSLYGSSTGKCERKHFLKLHVNVGENARKASTCLWVHVIRNYILHYSQITKFWSTSFTAQASGWDAQFWI